MNKKEYEKPAMRVVKIQHTKMLMISDPKMLSGPNKSGNGSQDADWYDLE